MYDFFKNIAEQNSCTLMGACSIHPSINALYQIILNEVREISVNHILNDIYEKLKERQ